MYLSMTRFEEIRKIWLNHLIPNVVARKNDTVELVYYQIFLPLANGSEHHNLTKKKQFSSEIFPHSPLPPATTRGLANIVILYTEI